MPAIPILHFLYSFTHYPLQQSQLSFQWRILNGGIKPGWRLHDRFLMREHIEAMLAMITAHSTLTDATKRQMVIGELPGGIVYATRSELNLFQPLFCFSPAARKYIKR